MVRQYSPVEMDPAVANRPRMSPPQQGGMQRTMPAAPTMVGRPAPAAPMGRPAPAAPMGRPQQPYDVGFVAPTATPPAPPAPAAPAMGLGGGTGYLGSDRTANMGGASAGELGTPWASTFGNAPTTQPTTPATPLPPMNPYSTGV